jgi:hypothetical protein
MGQQLYSQVTIYLKPQDNTRNPMQQIYTAPCALVLNPLRLLSNNRTPRIQQVHVQYSAGVRASTHFSANLHPPGIRRKCVGMPTFSAR